MALPFFVEKMLLSPSKVFLCLLQCKSDYGDKLHGNSTVGNKTWQKRRRERGGWELEAQLTNNKLITSGEAMTAVLRVNIHDKLKIRVGFLTSG